MGWGGVCKFTIKISGFISYSGSGSTKIWLHILEREEPTTPSTTPSEPPESEQQPPTAPITAPPKPAFQLVEMIKSLLDRIWEWLKSLLSFQSVQVAERLSIVSGDTAFPGDTFQHQFTLKNTKSITIPDTYYQDGAASYVYAVWFVVDESGNIIHSSDPIEVTSLAPGGTYTITASWQIPQQIATGKYAVTAVLLEFPMRWDSSQRKWVQGEPIIVDKQAVDVNVNPIPAPPKPDVWSWLSNLWNAIIEWLRSILPF